MNTGPGNKYTVLGLSEYHTLSNGTMDVWGTDVSDGHHTISELYDHRIKLFLALLKVYDTYITPLDARGSTVKCWKSKMHDDGSMYDGWFLAGITKTIPNFDASIPPERWDISYHIPLRFWNICTVMELPKAPPYDGYTSQDVAARLLKL